MRTITGSSVGIATAIQGCNRLITMAGGFATLLTGAAILSPTEFGVYVALHSVVQLRMLADALGGGAVVGFFIKSPEAQRKRIASHLGKQYITLGFLVTLLGAALILITRQGDMPATGAILAEGLLIVVALPFTVWAVGKIVILEGMQDVIGAAVARFMLSAGHIIVVLVTLICGAKLYSIGTGAIVSTGCATLYVLIKGKNRLSCSSCLPKRRKITLSGISPLSFKGLSGAIFVLQIRMLASWVGGYSMIFLPAPMIVYFASSADAGRIGFTLQLFQALVGLSLVPATVRLPVLARMIAMNEFDAERRYFSKIQAIAIWCYSFGILVILGLHPLIVGAVAELQEKLLDRNLFIIYGLTFMAILNLYVLSIKARAHSKEIFWPLYVAGGVLHSLILVYSTGQQAIFAGAVTLLVVDTLLFVVIARLFLAKNLKHGHG